MSARQAILAMVVPLLALLGAAPYTKAFEPQQEVPLNTPEEASVPRPLL